MAVIHSNQKMRAAIQPRPIQPYEYQAAGIDDQELRAGAKTIVGEAITILLWALMVGSAWILGLWMLT